MAWGPCEYCGYSECQCGMAAVPAWEPAKERMPKEGQAVLWHDPDDDVWPTFVGSLSGGRIDWGGDLSVPVPDRAFWMQIPERHVCRKRPAKKRQ